MWAPLARQAAVPVLVAVFCGTLVAAQKDKLSDLQAKFDHETGAVHKAKMLEKLGDAEFEEAGKALQENDFSTVGLLMEKYRDNVRAASEALKKEQPDAERHPNGYKQLEMHVQKGLREIGEFLLEVPPAYKPPLQIVQRDLLTFDDELLRALFPRRPTAKPPAPATPPPSSGPEKKP